MDNREAIDVLKHEKEVLIQLVDMNERLGMTKVSKKYNERELALIKAIDFVIEELEKETVSRETYNHEFNLRKEFEMKLFELEKKIAEQELSEDCISRKQAIEEMSEVPFILFYNYNMDQDELVDTIEEQIRECTQRMLNALPPAIPTERTGECRTCARNADNGGYYEPEHRTRCPIQEHYALLLDGYCHLYEPYGCGAKMDGEVDV